MFKEAMESFLSIIQQCGEELPLPIGNEKLNNAMQVVNQTLQNTSDKSILTMGETNSKKVVILMKIYAELVNLLVFAEPSLVGAVSLRMIDLTLKSGLTSACPCAFTFYGGTLVSMGNEYLTEACRLGEKCLLMSLCFSCTKKTHFSLHFEAKIALKLLERSASFAYRSNVISTAYFFSLWASDPFQVSAEAHLDGYHAGLQSGDHLYSVINKTLSSLNNLISGQSLTTVRQQLRDFCLKMQRKQIKFARDNCLMYHLQAVVLQDGESRLHDKCVDGLPGLGKILGGMEEVVKNGGTQDNTVSLLIKSLGVQQVFLFRQFDGVCFGNNNLMDVISEERHQLRPILLIGVFFEGLLSFQLARQTSNETRTEWIKKGVSVLMNMQCWARHCAWNFENKMLLLKAEHMHTIGKIDQAAELYTRSIRSAHDHKFMHEVAIASENAGDFYYERHNFPKSVALYKHSIKCYKEWGALAVAKRVENLLQSKIKGLGVTQLDSADDSLAFIFELQQSSSKKRPAN